MYAIETAKLSSKGQMVIPDSFRKRYGWEPGVTLMLIGTGDSVVVQSLPMPDRIATEKTLSDAEEIRSTIEKRVNAARDRLAAIKTLGISMPVGIEDGTVRMKALMGKHA